MSRSQQVALHGKDNRLGGIDPIPPGRWQQPGTASPFLNGWTNAGGGLQTFRWRRTNENQTEIQGVVTGGTAQPVINLPDPYRPAEIQYAVNADSDGALLIWTFEPSGDLSFEEAAAGGGASGPAGGVLDGTYPNPGIAASVAGAGLSESTNVLAVNVDNSTVEISSDNIRVKASGITANEIAADSVGESEIILADVTTEDVSTTKHGFVPKAPNDTGKFLRGDATWAAVSATGAVATDTIWDAKGDIAVGSGADSADNLAVGTDGHVLTADSAQTLGVKWAAASGGGGSTDGWIDDTGDTWTYASADAPTFTFTVSGDKTSSLSPGKKLKLTQTTIKYFIVTASSHSGGTTTVTIYGGTDYTLANAAISANYHSWAKAPDGFPLDPAKWTISVISDTSQRTQATPTSGTWYNLGSLSGAIHIGAWRVFYQVAAGYSRTSSTSAEVRTALSTANNSASDANMISYGFGSAASGTQGVWDTFHRECFLTLAAKTTYYLNAMQSVASAGTLFFEGSISPTIVKAVCAYL